MRGTIEIRKGVSGYSYQFKSPSGKILFRSEESLHDISEVEAALDIIREHILITPVIDMSIPDHKQKESFERLNQHILQEV